MRSYSGRKRRCPALLNSSSVLRTRLVTQEHAQSSSASQAEEQGGLGLFRHTCSGDETISSRSPATNGCLFFASRICGTSAAADGCPLASAKKDGQQRPGRQQLSSLIHSAPSKNVAPYSGAQHAAASACTQHPRAGIHAPQLPPHLLACILGRQQRLAFKCKSGPPRTANAPHLQAGVLRRQQVADALVVQLQGGSVVARGNEWGE